jgi:hypothetical protein
MRRITSPLILSYTNQLYTIGVTPATSNRELATFSRALYPGRREWGCCTDNQVCRVSMERENNTWDQWLTVEEEQRPLTAAAPWRWKVCGKGWMRWRQDGRLAQAQVRACEASISH